MVLFFANKSKISLGAVNEEKQMSMKDNKFKMKYIGDFKRLPRKIVSIMRRLPRRMTV
jgi:hypothetical protein